MMARPVGLAILMAAAGCGGDGGPWASTSAPATTAPTSTTAATTTSSTTAAPLATVRVATDGSGDAPDLATAVAMVAVGGTIVLNPGDHLLSAPLIVDKPLTIRGAGSDQTTVTGSLPPNLLLFTGLGDFRLEGITFRYLGTELADGLVVEGGAIAFNDVVVSGLVRGPEDAEDPEAEAGGTGFVVRGDASGTLDRCAAEENQLHGFGFLGTARVTIRDSTAADNGQNGFAWMEDSTGTAEGNIARGNGLHGFDTEDRAETTLTGNLAEGNGEGGFVWQQDAAGMGDENTATGNGLHGFGTEDQAETTLTDNSSTGNGQCGFRWAQDATGEARRNAAEGNGLCGFWIADAAAPTLINNVARSNRHAEGYGSGLAYAGTAGGVARRNQVYDNDWGIAIGPDAVPVLTHNDVHDNTRDLYQDAPVY